MTDENALDRIEAARILIVDDEPANVEVLHQMLTEAGFSRIHSMTDSRDVVDAVTDDAPDLIALDLLMPHVDGFEVIARIRGASLHESRLPILVLTADDTQEAKQRALALGANDFLSKPFDLLEVILRVRNLLRTHMLYQQLLQHNDLLDAKVRERTRKLDDLAHELEELNRTKSELVQVLAHELFTPITAIRGAGLTLQRFGDQIGPDDVQALVEGIDVGTDRLQRLIGNLRAAAALDRDTARIDRVDTAISSILDTLAEEHPRHRDRIAITVDESCPSVISVDPGLVARALGILVENGLDLAPVDSMVDVHLKGTDGDTTISVSDRGPGVPEDYRARIFLAFTQSERSTTRSHEGLGIGLFLAARILRLHGGDIQIQDRPGGGSVFTLRFPAPKVDEPRPPETPASTWPVLSGFSKG